MLEAVLIASIMVSAVAFVVTFEQPIASSYSAREALSVKAKDALDILYDTPVTSKFGDDALSAYIAECLNQRCGNLTQKLAKLVPAGASYALYVSNGVDTYPVLINGTPGGEAVTASRTFEPAWSSTFLATATESIGADDALLVYALPIFHSTAVTPGGSQILVKVRGTRADGSEYVLLASTSTVAEGSTELDAVAASLYFRDNDGNPLPVHDLASASSWPQRLALRLAETQNAAIPAGTEVVVNTPRGWTATAPQADNPKWTILTNADDKNGSYVGSAIRATLNAPLKNDVADLVFDLTYHEDVLDFYPITASLSKGATATASVLVRADEHSPDPPLATPMLHLSTPSPMGRGAQTTWTLSAHIPVSDEEPAEEVSSIVTIREIELIEQEGNFIFPAGNTVTYTPSEAMGGAWTSGGDSLRWTGSVALHLNQPLNLTFRVGASGTAGPDDARAAFLPPVTFDEWTGRLVGRTGWGFSRQAILPANDDYAGYEPESAALGLMHPLNSTGVYRQAELAGHIQYNVSLVGSVEDSLYGSYVTAERRSVPVGGDVVINANVQSLLFALAEAGQPAGITLRFYPPWSGDERVPIFKQENLDQGLLSGEVTQLITLDVNGDGYPDPIIGTSNGRVIGYHGLTGQRLQGNTFSVPLSQAGAQSQGVPRITTLAPTKLYGKDYIVVGTDRNGEGLFVLNTSFGVRWQYPFGAGDTLALDASISMDADAHPEIVVARSYDVGASKYALVYVFHADPPTPDTEPAGHLVPRQAAQPPVDDPDALYVSLGTPSTILAQKKVGPWGDREGIMVPIQTTVNPGLTYTLEPPAVQRGPTSTPRAGVQGIDEFGRPTSTLFGAPASVLRTYDHNGDPVDDVLLGGSSGYVVMANGTVLTQPLYSLIVAPVSKTVSADTVSSVESYTLSSQGQVLWTDDAWTTIFGPTTLAVGAKAIASDGWNSFWVVGEGNKVWRDVYVPTPHDAGSARWPEYKEIAPETITVAGYSFATNIHEFRTVEFAGARGYIGGTACPLPVVCGEPILLATANAAPDTAPTWTRLSFDTGTLLNMHGGKLDKNITRVKIMPDGMGWAVGDGGLIARNVPPSGVWQELDTRAIATTFSYDLTDIACMPYYPSTCIVVGESGAAFRTTNALAATPVWENLTGKWGLPVRDLYSVGYSNSTTSYIGSHNMVLASFHGSNWTALPLNYFENDGLVVSATPDGYGTGYVYGGTDATARIWFLHDHHISSTVQASFADQLEPGSRVFFASISGGNASLAQQTATLSVATNGDDWKTLTLLGGKDGDPRGLVATSFLTWMETEVPTPGSDVRVRLDLTTAGDKTLFTPQVRDVTVRVDYLRPAGETWESATKYFTLDFNDQTRFTGGTGDWNVSASMLRQPIVQEYWTRNVSGQVHDIQTGFNVLGDARKEVWVATGDVLAENSPDHIIYAGTDLNKLIEKHNRVYLLDGLNGQPARISQQLEGEVRQIRLVDQDNNGAPEVLFAATWDTSGTPSARGKLYALDPLLLDVLWSVDLEREVPVDMEVAKFVGPTRGVFVGSERPPDETGATPHLWAIDESTKKHKWKVIPDDMGNYLITTKVKPSWLYGPHVVEIEVEWEEGVEIYVTCRCPDRPDPPEGPEPPGGWPDPESETHTVLRSARFYDHFMVTPPDAVSSPYPVYTARLLMWMRDWG